LHRHRRSSDHADNSVAGRARPIASHDASDQHLGPAI